MNDITAVTAKELDVPVRGGALHCGQWGDEGPVVLAVHGITASFVSWELVARRLAGTVRVVAPDLRGRGGSSTLPGPCGLAQHAEDLAAVLDHFGTDRAVVVGHSMGAFVANVMAVLHPTRVQSLVLVDGGLPLPLPPGLSVDEALQAVIGPAMARLSMTFPTRQAYHDFWRAHPAFADSWGPMVQAYVDYDLVGEEPELRSRVSIDAVRDDSANTLSDEFVGGMLERLPVDAVLLRAERGLLNEERPLLPDDVVAAGLARGPRVRDLGVVPGTNHYTIGLSEHGADAVAAAVSAAVADG